MSYVVLKCSKWTLASVFSFGHHMKYEKLECFLFLDKDRQVLGQWSAT